MQLCGQMCRQGDAADGRNNFTLVSVTFELNMSAASKHLVKVMLSHYTFTTLITSVHMVQL